METIDKLNLERVKSKFLSRKGFLQRLFIDVNKIEAEYKQFLTLIFENPDTPISPWNQSIDDLWHEHILDTKKYTEDCQAIFGKYIHHNPHVDNLQLAHNNTKKLLKDKSVKASHCAPCTLCFAGCGHYEKAKLACSSCGTCSFCAGD